MEFDLAQNRVEFKEDFTKLVVTDISSGNQVGEFDLEKYTEVEIVSGRILIDNPGPIESSRKVMKPCSIIDLSTSDNANLEIDTNNNIIIGTEDMRDALKHIYSGKSVEKYTWNVKMHPTGLQRVGETITIRSKFTDPCPDFEPL